MSDLHTTEEWIKILNRQADYTREYRHTLYKKVDLHSKEAILDVGCGTGVITADIALLTKGCITGIDIDGKKLAYAKTVVPDHVTLLTADVTELPFKNETFDLVVFSVVLPYIQAQQHAVNEMARVTKKNGIVLATYEPDYAGELYYPEDTAHSLYLQYLKDIGIDMCTGRKIKYLFRKAGLHTEVGICDVTLDFVNKDTEEQLNNFLTQFPSYKKKLLQFRWTEQQIDAYKQEQINLIQDDLVFFFVPAFYAIGRK